jgi:hypothetical protein
MIDNAEPQEQPVYYVICHECGKRYAPERTYCDCINGSGKHPRLPFIVHAGYWREDTLPHDMQIGAKCNVDREDRVCADCNYQCAPCSMFGVMRKDDKCKYKREGSPRCTCCENEIKEATAKFGL